jgi:hypothetical protein
MCFATHIFDFCRLHNAEYDSIQSFRLLSAHLPSLLLVVESIVNVIPRLQNHSLFSLRMHHLKKIDIDHLLGRTPNELTIDNWQCFFLPGSASACPCGKMYLDAQGRNQSCWGKDFRSTRDVWAMVGMGPNPSTLQQEWFTGLLCLTWTCIQSISGLLVGQPSNRPHHIFSGISAYLGHNLLIISESSTTV